jgi:hypothetical protein
VVCQRGIQLKYLWTRSLNVKAQSCNRFLKGSWVDFFARPDEIVTAPPSVCNKGVGQSGDLDHP